MTRDSGAANASRTAESKRKDDRKFARPCREKSSACDQRVAAAGFGFAYAQAEDHLHNIMRLILAERGQSAEMLGPELDALVGDDRFFVNPSLLRKRLVVLSDKGRLSDDTTIGILRRRRT